MVGFAEMWGEGSVVERSTTHGLQALQGDGTSVKFGDMEPFIKGGLTADKTLSLDDGSHTVVLATKLTGNDPKAHGFDSYKEVKESGEQGHGEVVAATKILTDLHKNVQLTNADHAGKQSVPGVGNDDGHSRC